MYFPMLNHSKFMIGMYFYKVENKLILQDFVKVSSRNLVKVTSQRLSKT